MHIFSRLLIIFIFVVLTACSQKNDFDTLCTYFDLLEKETKLNEMTAQDKFNYINNLIKLNLKLDSDARVSWNAIVNLAAEKRYQMFIEAAYGSSKKTWQCSSMKMIIGAL